VLHLYQPTLGMKAIVVVDNVACGPAIGGTRMAPDVSFEECFRLARAMTLKNAAAGLPHGGAKSVIFGDPLMDPDLKEQWIRAFAQGIRGITDYIPGPDMGTNEAAMAFIKDEGGRSAGLPRELGGIPLDEVGATAKRSAWSSPACASPCRGSVRSANTRLVSSPGKAHRSWRQPISRARSSMRAVSTSRP
jgi:glutamate dehydrogenase (NAD(P)+)